MKRVKNVRYNEETEEYEVICPFCHKVLEIDWPYVYDECTHLVYVHETVNGRLGNSDSDWLNEIIPLLIKHADELDMEYYIEDSAEIDEDEDGEVDLLELAPEYMEDFINDGYISVEQIISILEAEGRTDILDRLVIDSIIEVESGDGTYYVFDSKDPNVTASDIDDSYIKEID